MPLPTIIIVTHFLIIIPVAFCQREAYARRQCQRQPRTSGTGECMNRFMTLSAYENEGRKYCHRQAAVKEALECSRFCFQVYIRVSVLVRSVSHNITASTSSPFLGWLSRACALTLYSTLCAIVHYIHTHTRTHEPNC